MMTTHAVTIITQDKARSYIEQASRNDFILLAIEISNCFHPHFDFFLIFCIHAYITRHQQTSLVPLIFISHCRQRVSIALQCAQAITIL